MSFFEVTGCGRGKMVCTGLSPRIRFKHVHRRNVLAAEVLSIFYRGLVRKLLFIIVLRDCRKVKVQGDPMANTCTCGTCPACVAAAGGKKK